jgi:hypothetical protein
MYIVFPVLLFESSVASFILCASPPESSVDGCPNLMYESPTSLRVSIFLLTDVYVPCEVCDGKRYNRETLEVKYKGKSIYDVLDMTVQ